MIIFDNHLHLRRDGLYLQAIQEFQNAGGTHCILCQYPMPELVIQHKSYLPAYTQTLTMAEEIRENTDVCVYVTVGPYPVDYITLRKHFDRHTTLQLMRQGIDEAAALCKEHELVVGIGEIGRPHFPVDQQIINDSNDLLIYGMQQAKDAEAPVILHTETTTPQQCKELSDMAKQVGLSTDQVVKHYAPPLVTFKENHGLIPSVLASKKNIENALQKSTRFLMETDYIDDLQRPGAVLGPKTVPKVTKYFLDQGLLSEKQAYDIHVNLPVKTYKVAFEQ